MTKLQTEEAIELVKTTFLKQISKEVKLTKVSSPMVVLKGVGINDDLNGSERPVGFPIKDMKERRAEVVHSLAKWKRLRLKDYSIEEGTGIITDMKALRPDEDLTPLHSIYVDQWDWEKHISKEQRTIETLKEEVLHIYASIKATEQEVAKYDSSIVPVLPAEITFIHTEELLEQYPTLTSKEREDEVAKKYGAVFIMGIGGEMSNGERHDGRAPDYDDWSSESEKGWKGLNGDIVVWNEVLGRAFEISSMGIRVDKDALERQLKIAKCEDRKDMFFHKQLLEGKLTESIGGGIGQSRLCMFLLQKRHIGEVQVSIWSDKILKECSEQGIELL